MSVVRTAVVSNREQFDGIDTVVPAPSFHKEEAAYLKATERAYYESLEGVRQRLRELLAYASHQRAYKKRTELFVEIVQQLEEEGHVPEAAYVFENGVLSRPLTTGIEAQGKVWLSDLEKSRNINCKGDWRRVDDVAEELRREHPQAFRKPSKPGVTAGHPRFFTSLAHREPVVNPLRYARRKRLLAISDCVAWRS